MNNDEKREFLINVERLLMDINPYSNRNDASETLAKEDLLWERFKKTLLGFQPKSLFKYRKINENNLKVLENKEAWFSIASEFGDMSDLTLNTDIEKELEDIETNKEEHLIKLSSAFVNLMLKQYGKQVKAGDVENVMHLFSSDGAIKVDETYEFLKSNMPEYAAFGNVNKLIKATDESNQKALLESVKGFLNLYLDINKRNRNELYVYSLAEEPDNLAMWETYADNATGFCLEFMFEQNSFVGQRMLLNLLPIIYGEKEPIKFFDVLIRSITANKTREGIAVEDYEKWFLESYTKDPSYSFQKEWRIVFTKTMGGNLQSFPFVKSIILGEKISDANKEKLIAIAKKIGADVYERHPNKTHSRIITSKINLD